MDNYKSSYPCIVCGKEVKLLHPEDVHRMNDKTNQLHRATSQMWDDGTIFEEGCGYGSRLDGSVYLIAVCDTCLEQKGIKTGEYM